MITTKRAKLSGILLLPSVVYSLSSPLTVALAWSQASAADPPLDDEAAGSLSRDSDAEKQIYNNENKETKVDERATLAAAEALLPIHSSTVRSAVNRLQRGKWRGTHRATLLEIAVTSVPRRSCCNRSKRTQHPELARAQEHGESD